MLKLLLPFLFCNLLSGASFNCTKASSNVEKMICTDVFLSELDTQMGTLYKEASKSTTNKKELLDNQRIWIKERENCATADCISSTTKNRISQLENLISTKSQDISTNIKKVELQVGSTEKIPFDISIKPVYNEVWGFTYPLITITALEDLCLELALIEYRNTPMGKNFGLLADGTYEYKDIRTLPNGGGYEMASIWLIAGISLS